jgi:D-alanyl-lipoteichoic acid acyltransferase DltB (MBOAT superfamily)
MPVYSSVAFPLVVAACYVLIQLRSQVRRTAWFGALNIFAVTVLFGWRPALVLLIVSFACWTLLAVALRLKSAVATRSVGLIGPILYLSVALVFITHKSLLEPQSDFAQFRLMSLFSRVGSMSAVHSVMQTLQIIALSYIFLRLIDLIRSVLDGSRLLDPLSMSGFLAPFFMTPAGPINVYTEHLEMDERAVAPVTAVHFIDSAFLIVCGYFLKFVLAQLFSIFVTGISGNWPTTTIAGTATFLLYVLIEFSGYSLVALGVGKLLSVPTPVNFNHPYLATTVGEFWNRWHMSLGQFVRRNLYIPIQVSLMRRFGRKNREAAYFSNLIALSLPFIFVGVWHRFRWSFLLWGISLAVIVAVEKLVRDRVLVRGNWLLDGPEWLKSAFGIIYTLTIVVVTLHIASRDFLR